MPDMSTVKDASDKRIHAASKWPYSDRMYKATIKREGDAADGGAKETRPSCNWKSRLCSLPLWFVVAAAIQMVVTVVLQANIFFYEGGNGTIIEQYRNCVSDNLSKAIECNTKNELINISITIPSFGKDTPVYIWFIVALSIYNSLLCFYALYGKHFLEIISFLIVNVLTMMYAAFQAWLFRPFTPKCTLLPNAAKYSLATMGILFLFTIFFVTMTFYIYRDFGWKIYKHVDCNHRMRRYYQWYEAVSSGIKLVILFTIVFSAGQLKLLLLPTDPEFVLTLILVIVAIVVYFIVQLSIHYNSFIGYLLISFTGVLLFFYYAFKIERFATATCPTCILQRDLLRTEYTMLQDLFRNCTGGNLTVSASEIDRSIQFQSLTIFATVNLITVVIVFIIFIGFVCRQPGKQIKEHFQKHPSLIVWLMCYQRGEDPLLDQIRRSLGIKEKAYNFSPDESNQ